MGVNTLLLCWVSVFRPSDAGAETTDPQKSRKWPCWPTPSLVLVIFPGTATHRWLTQIQSTYTFISFMATIHSEPLKKPLRTKVNTRGLKRPVCLLPRTWSVCQCLLILKVELIVQVGKILKGKTEILSVKQHITNWINDSSIVWNNRTFSPITSRVVEISRIPAIVWSLLQLIPSEIPTDCKT